MSRSPCLLHNMPLSPLFFPFLFQIPMLLP
jgi:hypothetical protein